MPAIEKNPSSEDFLKSLGFPVLSVHDTFTHFDFTKPGRRVLLIGPMGAGKTEFAARVWRDAAVAQTKSDRVKELTSTNGVDRRNIFFVRSEIDGAALRMSSGTILLSVHTSLMRLLSLMSGLPMSCAMPR